MRKNNFLKRFKVGIDLAFKKKNARLMTCSNCDSTDIMPISNSLEEPFSTKEVKADMMYIQFSKCRKCGAVCKEIQLWNHLGNVGELDARFIEDKLE